MRVELITRKWSLPAPEAVFQQQRRAEYVRPSYTDIEGGHGVFKIPRNIKRPGVNHVEAIVTEKQAIFAADLLINAEVIVIGVIYVGLGRDRIEHSGACKIGPGVVGLDELQHGWIDSVHWNHIWTASSHGAGRVVVASRWIWRGHN